MERAFQSTVQFPSGFNKYKDDLTWFIKKVVGDKKSYTNNEVSRYLLKMFADAVTNIDGFVTKTPKIVTITTSIPKSNGYAPMDTKLYKIIEEKENARQEMFMVLWLKMVGPETLRRRGCVSRCLRRNRRKCGEDQEGPCSWLDLFIFHQIITILYTNP